jgi:hypothetical protein
MNRIKAMVLGLCLTGLVTGVSAQALTPETFVQADIEARQVTLEGMSARLSQLQQGAASAAQAQADEQNHMTVDAVFRRYGTDGASHAAYGTQRRDEVSAWLAANPEYQHQYDAITDQFEALSQQFEALQGGNQE